jgi:hypothetical protein
MSETEDDLVGAKTAGSATYNRLIDQTLTKILTRHLGEIKESKATVAFVGLDNESGEDLGDWHRQIESAIETAVENANRYDLVSRRFVQRALRELRFRPDDLFIRKNQRQFAEVLELEKNLVDFLLFAELTSGTTVGTSLKQRNYQLKIDLINIDTGRGDMESTVIRKEYQQ